MIDTIIVGAGPAGLCAAKTILQCDANADIKIYDAQATLGGVWSQEKMYPTLKSNHHFGGLDFSDFPMQEQYGAKKGNHVPGTAVHQFLCDYARQWNLPEKIEFRTKVIEVERSEDEQGWMVKIEQNGQQSTQQCRKLIIATGITNKPRMPQHRGSSDFGVPILHSSELGGSSEAMFSDEQAKTVAVLGGGKSAFDAVYLAAMNGRKVEWVIRKSGKGPCWLMPLLMKLGPWVIQRDWLPATRFISWWSPCIWNDGYEWIRSWIHDSAVGKFVAQKFWAQLHTDTISDCGYRTHDSLKILEPETSPFWYGTISGAYNYEPGLFDFIKSGRVRIHREDIESLSERTIHLANGDDLAADVLIQATGFSAESTIRFNPPSLHSSLGIPTTSMTREQEMFWQKLDTASDKIIGEKFPRLLAGPYQNPSSDTALLYNPGVNAEVSYSPFRLYRSIAPPGLAAQGDRSLAFIGIMSNFANFARIELQCLWTYAYLNDRIAGISRDNNAGNEKAIFEEASLMSRYSRHRSPFGHGRFYPDHVFDQLPYNDVLVQDLGLSPWRKRNALKEIFGPYTVKDYRGLVEEWKGMYLKV